jgi:hypothetical protein
MVGEAMRISQNQHGALVLAGGHPGAGKGFGRVAYRARHRNGDDRPAKESYFRLSALHRTVGALRINASGTSGFFGAGEGRLFIAHFHGLQIETILTVNRHLLTTVAATM